jgi:hypothetical protein
MDFRIQVASIVVGFLIWTIVAIALKRARLYPSYAVLWAGIGAMLVLLPLYANSLRWLAGNVFGIVGANHLIYAILFSFLMIYLFYLTQKVCELINRVERLIVFVAMLDTRQKTGSLSLDALSGNFNRPQTRIDAPSLPTT